MKKSVLIPFLLAFSFPLYVNGFELSFSNGDLSFSQDNISLYNFSSDLLNAVQNCTPYTEDFMKNNPSLADTAHMFGALNPTLDIHIKGKDEKGFCHFSVINNLIGIQVFEHRCSVSDEQLKEIYLAMTDKSTKPVTETFTTYAHINDANGSEKKIPIETTMTDSKFNIVWSKINADSCEQIERDPEPEFFLGFKDSLNNFSSEFSNNLINCQPDQEEKTFLFFSKKATIVGKENNLCHIIYGSFDLKIPMDRVDEIRSMQDFEDLIEDETIARYIPEYEITGLSFELDNCRQGMKHHKGAVQTTTQNNIKITKGLSSSFSDGVCTIDFTNKVSINGKEKDYSKKCSIPQSHLDGLLSAYKNIIQDKPEQSRLHDFSSRGQTDEADKNLYQKLIEQKFCR